LKFNATEIPGVFVITAEPVEDERGFFARMWCREEFAAKGLDPDLAQCSIAFNRVKGTIRGMHVQLPPHAEAKLVRCTRGAIFDVALDLRGDSPTFRRWTSVELTAENRNMLYIPAGVAHGYQTLVEDAEVFYQISAPYHSESSSGVRWDDPAFRIGWPLGGPLLSQRDRSYEDFKE